MAFIVLRRSRGTRSYYLVESYRDRKGKSRKRTLCYPGREQDGTDTLEKAIRHWEKVRDQPCDRRRKTMATRKLAFLNFHLTEEARDKALRFVERVFVMLRWERGLHGRRRYKAGRADNGRASTDG
jgi:hypothetical protein